MSETNQPTSTPATAVMDRMDPKTNKGTYKPKVKYDSNKKRRNDESKRTTYACDTPEMLGHIFQVHSEQCKKGQF